MGNPWLLGEVERAICRLYAGPLLQVRSTKEAKSEPLHGSEEIEQHRRLPGRYETARLHFDKLLLYKGNRAVQEMRKHASWYMSGIPGAAALRNEINTALTGEEMYTALEKLKGWV